MNTGKTTLAFALTLLLLAGCKADDEYSVWPCRFAYDNMVHQDATLAAAMSNASRGVFCIISESTRSGKKYLNFQNSNGDSSEQPESAEEQQANFILGINNGIIVGFQTLNTDGANGGFVGYDIQCPNCARRENNTVNPNYRVSIDDKGIATCSRCHKTYDLNNGGLIRNGQEGDTGLEKYVATTSGPFGVVSVFRR
ncbi:MAG: hypothetical protein J1E37_06840 [Prevotella sp.]|nr:hypothetical protein [Prevotella sp.]